jgi:hypothetical protein
MAAAALSSRHPGNLFPSSPRARGVLQGECPDLVSLSTGKNDGPVKGPSLDGGIRARLSGRAIAAGASA